MYFYVYNLQGDVTHILDADSNIVGTYTYDAWGKITNLSSLTAISQANPFRYRGYYYDTESGLYYLNSRYYNPDWGRFLNADDVSLLGVDGDFSSYNLFVYCGNNPVVRADNNGHWWNVAIGAVIGGATNAISAFLTGSTTSEIIVSTLCGAVSGGFAATGFGGIAKQVAMGAVTSLIDSGYQNFKEYEKNKKTFAQAVASTVVDTAIGATFAAVGFEGTDAFKNSNKIAKNAKKAINTLSQKVVHPTVKSNAKSILRQSGQYISKEIKQCFVDNTITSIFSYGIGKLAELFY